MNTNTNAPTLETTTQSDGAGTNPHGLRVMSTALVRVHGRRVSWSLTPDWSPAAPAFGPAYLRAKAAGLGGTSRAHAEDAVRRAFRLGARAVLVYGIGERIVLIRKVGNDLRTAWSDTDAWAPHLQPTGREYEAARDLGLAGVVYGAAAMDKVLGGPGGN